VQAERGLERKGGTPYLSKQDELPSLKSRHYEKNLHHFKAMRSFHLAYARLLTLTNSKKREHDVSVVLQCPDDYTARRCSRESSAPSSKRAFRSGRPFSADELALFGRVVLFAATPESRTVTEGLPFRSAEAVVRCSKLRLITLRVCGQDYRKGAACARSSYDLKVLSPAKHLEAEPSQNDTHVWRGATLAPFAPP
jgi:hypothetical protein